MSKKGCFLLVKNVSNENRRLRKKIYSINDKTTRKIARLTMSFIFTNIHAWCHNMTWFPFQCILVFYTSGNLIFKIRNIPRISDLFTIKTTTRTYMVHKIANVLKDNISCTCSAEYYTRYKLWWYFQMTNVLVNVYILYVYFPTFR